MGMEGWQREDPTNGDKELKEAWDTNTLWTGSIKMGNGEHATSLDMSEIWDGLQGSDCNGSGSTSMAKFLNRAGGHSTSQVVFSGLQNWILPKGAKWNCWLAS